MRSLDIGDLFFTCFSQLKGNGISGRPVNAFFLLDKEENTPNRFRVKKASLQDPLPGKQVASRFHEEAATDERARESKRALQERMHYWYRRQVEDEREMGDRIHRSVILRDASLW